MGHIPCPSTILYHSLLCEVLAPHLSGTLPAGLSVYTENRQQVPLPFRCTTTSFLLDVTAAQGHIALDPVKHLSIEGIVCYYLTRTLSVSCPIIPCSWKVSWAQPLQLVPLGLREPPRSFLTAAFCTLQKERIKGLWLHSAQYYVCSEEISDQFPKTTKNLLQVLKRQVQNVRTQ